jgi:hypothetical protein
MMQNCFKVLNYNNSIKNAFEEKTVLKLAYCRAIAYTIALLIYICIYIGQYVFIVLTLYIYYNVLEQGACSVPLEESMYTLKGLA